MKVLTLRLSSSDKFGQTCSGSGSTGCEVTAVSRDTNVMTIASDGDMLHQHYLATSTILKQLCSVSISN